MYRKNSVFKQFRKVLKIHKSPLNYVTKIKLIIIHCLCMVKTNQIAAHRLPCITTIIGDMITVLQYSNHIICVLQPQNIPSSVVTKILVFFIASAYLES